MKLRLLSIPFFLFYLGIQTTQAQSVLDNAHLLSKDIQTGTARFKAMGNVQTAVGGDISSITGNPAGLGFYGQSDLSISTSFFSNQNSSNYFGQQTKIAQNKFGLENIGLVIHSNVSQDPDFGWQSFNMGFSFDRQSNFNEKLSYAGNNTRNTIVQYLSDEMFYNSGFTSDFRKSYLVDQFADAANGYFPTVLEADPKNQQFDHTNQGYKYHTNISFGANYGNKIYVGMSVGFLTYKSTFTQSVFEGGWTKRADEITPDNPNSEFAKPNTVESRYLDINYELTDYKDMKTEGTGGNLSLGLIYKPSWDWNLGVSFTSPTWTEVKQEDWLETVANYYEDENATNTLHPAYNSKVGGGILEYSILTPWKASFGATKFHGRGLFSAEIEYVDYSVMNYTDISLDPNINQENEFNKTFSNQFKGNANVRLGTEYLFTDQLTGRAGVNFIGSAFKDVKSFDSNISLGLGYVLASKFYVDFAAVKSVNKAQSHTTYQLEDVWNSPNPTADVKNSRLNMVLTLGTKF